MGKKYEHKGRIDVFKEKKEDYTWVGWVVGIVIVLALIGSVNPG